MILVIFVLSFVLSLLVSASLDTETVEVKMTENAYSQAVAFQAAESALSSAESHIRQQTIALIPSGAKAHYSIRLLDTDACGRKRYRIHAVGEYRRARVRLVSEYVRLIAVTNKSCEKEKIDQRVFWGVDQVDAKGLGA